MSDADLTQRVAALRGAGQFGEAVDLFKRNAASVSGDERRTAMIQAFHAAREGHLFGEARELAHAIAEEEPDLPAIQEYLD